MIRTSKAVVTELLLGHFSLFSVVVFFLCWVENNLIIIRIIQLGQRFLKSFKS